MKVKKKTILFLLLLPLLLFVVWQPYRPTTYEYEGKIYYITYLSDKDFEDKVNSLVNTPSWLEVQLMRGFTTVNTRDNNLTTIWIRNTIKIGINQLILHEIGHLNGLDHLEWYQHGTMHPYWFMRF